MEEGRGTMAAFDDGSTSQRDDNLLDPKHSIFLSHSGAQKSFVEQLCLDIEAHDRYPFFDKRRDSLPIGYHFPSLIFEAINQCQVAVVVLSEEFFSRSKWPMLELAALVKRKSEDPKLIIMPVFLGMTHAKCREKGNHDRWLRQWQSWAEKDKRIIIEEWQAALQVFGYTNGVSLRNSDEVKCRDEIVEAICKEVHPASRWNDSHVQGRWRLCKVICEKIEDLNISKCYGVRILGIYGVGGIGKSTACMALCNNYFKEFYGRVCHAEFGNGNELQMLQKMLKTLTNTKAELAEKLNTDECKERMQRTIKNQKVLLAIDNVSEAHHIVMQAKDILRLGFKEGSIVIVTARSLGELQNVNIHESECIEMPELIEDEAMSLFLFHATPALQLENLGPTVEQVTRQCVQRCRFGKGNGMSYHYHPLALKVLGGQLGHDPTQWRRKMEGIDPFNQYREKEDMHPIFSILRRSFETLNAEDQLLFMDAAIFYPESFWLDRRNIFEWMSMVHGASVDAILTMLGGLKNKSLLENVGDGSRKIGMHDLWREFAVMKAKGGQFHPRPYIYEKVYELSDRRREESSLSGGGWESLQRIFLEGVGCHALIQKELNLSRCSNLRVLKLVDVNIESAVLDVSSMKQLKSLEFISRVGEWRSIYIFGEWRSICILGLGYLRNLVHLRLLGLNSVTTSTYDEIGGLTSLQAVDIEDSSSLRVFPDFSRLHLLRHVFLHLRCSKVEKIRGLSSKMSNLKVFHLSCSFLRSCDGVGDLVALEELDLSDCGMLEELPNLGRLKNLLELKVSGCKLLKAVPGLGDLVSLQVFNANGCFELAELPDMRKLVNLRKLSFGGCSSIQAMSDGLSDLIALERLETEFGAVKGYRDMRKLTKLETVRIGRWNGEVIPWLSDLVTLKDLWIGLGEEVDEWSWPLNLPTLQELTISGLWGKSNLRTLPCLSDLTSLTSLSVFNCKRLVRLPDIRGLSRLESLYIASCPSLREWGCGSGLTLFGVDLHNAGTMLPHLQTLTLWLVAFSELPDLSYFPQLRELVLSGCEKLMRLTSSSPLTALEILCVIRCGSLSALPDLSHLVSLRELKLKYCRRMQLSSHEIENLKAMCPGLNLDLESPVPKMELENEDERDGKRLKVVENI